MGVGVEVAGNHSMVCVAEGVGASVGEEVGVGVATVTQAVRTRGSAHTKIRFICSAADNLLTFGAYRDKVYR